MSAKFVEENVQTNLEEAVANGSALLAVIGLERAIGSKLKINKKDINAAVSLGEAVAKRLVAFIAQDGFDKIKLNLNDRPFIELRNLLVDNFNEALLADQLEAIADADLALSFSLVLNDAVTFLQSRIPQLPARHANLKPSDFRVASFMRAWRTISDPMTVIGDLEMGCLSNDQVKVMKQIYPALYELMANAMVTAVSQKMVDPDYIVAYPKLKQISVLLQQPLVAEDLKGVLAAAFKSPDANVAPGGGGAMDPMASVATQNQKLEFGV